MNEQDNILRLAREAGLTTESGHWRGIAGFSLKYAAEKFAALVKAETVAETREACAKVCEAQTETGAHIRCAAAIRAMAETPSRECEA